MPKLKPNKAECAQRIFCGKVAAAQAMYSISRSDLATLVGRSESTVSGRKARLEKMSFDELVRWARALHLSPEDLAEIFRAAI